MKIMIVTGLLLTGMTAGLCLPAQADEPENATVEATVAGMKVGIDAKTGKLRPLTAAESQQLDQALTQGRKPQFAAGLARTFNQPADEAEARATARAIAGGGVSVKLPESQMSALSARQNSAGELVIEHISAADAGASHEESSHE